MFQNFAYKQLCKLYSGSEITTLNSNNISLMDGMKLKNSSKIQNTIATS